MAELEQALQTRLTGFSGLSALVGTRIYPLILPQPPTLPAVTYQRISASRWSSIPGDDGVAEPRMQVDAWALTYGAAKLAAAQVRLALERWSDDASSPVVLDVFLETDQDIYEPDTDIYRVSADYRVVHREQLS